MMQSFIPAMVGVASTLRCVALIAGMTAAGIFIIAWIVALTKWNGEKNCDMDCDTCPFPPCDKSTKEAQHGKP